MGKIRSFLPSPLMLGIMLILLGNGMFLIGTLMRWDLYANMSASLSCYKLLQAYEQRQVISRMQVAKYLADDVFSTTECRKMMDDVEEARKQRMESEKSMIVRELQGK